MKAIAIGDITVLQFENIKEAHKHGKNLRTMLPKDDEKVSPKRYYAAGDESASKKDLTAAITRAKELLEDV